MSSKTFYECGCMEQGDQFFECDKHRADADRSGEGPQKTLDDLKRCPTCRSADITDRGVKPGYWRYECVWCRAQFDQAWVASGEPTDLLENIRAAKYLNPECAAHGCQWLKAAALSAPAGSGAETQRSADRDFAHAFNAFMAEHIEPRGYAVDGHYTHGQLRTLMYLGFQHGAVSAAPAGGETPHEFKDDGTGTYTCGHCGGWPNDKCHVKAGGETPRAETALAARIETGLKAGRLLGPEFDGASLVELAEEVVRLRDALATEAAAQQEHEGNAAAWHRCVETILTVLGLSPALGADEAAVAVRDRLEQAEASLQQRTEALTKAQGLLREIYNAHRNRHDADYNECETAPCQFCAEVDEIDALLAPAPAVPSDDLVGPSELLPVARELRNRMAANVLLGSEAPAVPGTTTKEGQEPLSRMDTTGSSTDSRTASENRR